MTEKSWKKSQGKKGTPATCAGESTKERTKMESSLKSTYTLRALNDVVLVEEDDPEMESGGYTGFSKSAIDALKSGLLVAPEITEDAVKKYPGRGKVLAIGDKVNNGVSVGDRVILSRFGGQREYYLGNNYIFVRQSEILAII